jgi:uncharacterized RDD family membrane protein YckC
MPPELQADVSVIEVLLYAALNPATIAVAFLLGRQANEKNKLILASFGGALAGVAVLYFAALFKVWDAPTLGRSAAGVFVASLVIGLVYARIGYAFRKTD